MKKSARALCSGGAPTILGNNEDDAECVGDDSLMKLMGLAVTAAFSGGSTTSHVLLSGNKSTTMMIPLKLVDELKSVSSFTTDARQAQKALVNRLKSCLTEGGPQEKPAPASVAGAGSLLIQQENTVPSSLVVDDSVLTALKPAIRPNLLTQVQNILKQEPSSGQQQQQQQKCSDRAQQFLIDVIGEKTEIKTTDMLMALADFDDTHKVEGILKLLSNNRLDVWQGIEFLIKDRWLSKPMAETNPSEEARMFIGALKAIGCNNPDPQKWRASICDVLELFAKQKLENDDLVKTFLTTFTQLTSQIYRKSSPQADNKHKCFRAFLSENDTVPDSGGNTTNSSIITENPFKLSDTVRDFLQKYWKRCSVADYVRGVSGFVLEGVKSSSSDMEGIIDACQQTPPIEKLHRQVALYLHQDHRVPLSSIVELFVDDKAAKIEEFLENGFKNVTELTNKYSSSTKKANVVRLFFAGASRLCLLGVPDLDGKDAFSNLLEGKKDATAHSMLRSNSKTYLRCKGGDNKALDVKDCMVCVEVKPPAGFIADPKNGQKLDKATNTLVYKICRLGDLKSAMKLNGKKTDEPSYLLPSTDGRNKFESLAEFNWNEPLERVCALAAIFDSFSHTLPVALVRESFDGNLIQILNTVASNEEDPVVKELAGWLASRSLGTFSDVTIKDWIPRLSSTAKKFYSTFPGRFGRLLRGC